MSFSTLLISVPGASTQQQISQIAWENDNYAPPGTDRHYTNGVRFSTASAENRLPTWSRILAPGMAPWLIPMLRRVKAARPQALESGESYLLNSGWSAGQNMYTPESIETSAPVPDDRPYGAWLYYGALARISSANQRLWHWFELDAGVIGPPALGEPAQRFVHHVLGAPQPKGWPNQIDAQLGVVARYDPRYVLLDNAFGRAGGKRPKRYIDLTPSIGYVAGNLFTYATGSALLRAGWNIPDASPERITPAVHRPRTPATIGYEDRPGTALRWFLPRGLYVFGSAEGRAVAANLFVDPGLPAFAVRSGWESSPPARYWCSRADF